MRSRIRIIVSAHSSTMFGCFAKHSVHHSPWFAFGFACVTQRMSKNKALVRLLTCMQAATSWKHLLSFYYRFIETSLYNGFTHHNVFKRPRFNFLFCSQVELNALLMVLSHFGETVWIYCDWIFNLISISIGIGIFH